VTKQQLREYRDIKAQVRQLDEQIREWRYRASCCVKEVSSVTPGTSRWNDYLPHIIDKITECEKARDDKIVKLVNIEAALTVLDEREARIFRAYYIEGKNWDMVAHEMNYCVEYIIRIHGWALKKLQK